MSKRVKRPWGFIEKIMVAALVLCLAAAGVMIALIVSESTERTEANADYSTLEREFLYTGSLPETQETEKPVMEKEGTEAEGTEEESVQDDAELLVLLHNEALVSEQPGKPMTPPPTFAATKAVETTPPTHAPTRAVGTSLPTYGPTKAVETTPPTHVTHMASPSIAPTAAPTEVVRVGEAVLEDVRYSADFGSLQKINEDVVGWLVQEGTQINYPIVQGEDNTYYLTRLYTGGTNRNGSIFMDCGNAPYFTDMITYLYGHNRKDGTMFASLHEYQNQAYYQAHPNMTLLTPYEDYRLEVFACIRASVENNEEWHTKSLSGRVEFDAFVDRVMKESKITTAIRPRWGDQLLAMCTCTNEVRDDRYIVFARLNPIVYQTDESISVMQLALETEESVSGYVDVPGRGPMQYYAQNDPVWAKMRYETRGSKQSRRFGSGGCGPTSMAMVVANLVAEENYWWISYYSGRESGITFCTCSVNQYFCNHKHSQYRPETPSEYKRYLPVTIASFATGNNQWKEKSRTINGFGTKPVFMKRISEAYALIFDVSKDRQDAMDVLTRGGMAVAVTGGKTSPFTGGGHYVTLASVDAQYLYILDPYLKQDYSKTDKKGVLDQIEPGLLRVKLEDIDELCLSTFYLFEAYDFID